MNKVERVLSLGLVVLVLVWLVIVVLSFFLDGFLINLLIIIVGILAVLFWSWYFEVDLGKYYLWKYFFVGLIFSLLLWLVARILWTIMGYGGFIGIYQGIRLDLVLSYFVYILLAIVVYGKWLSSELKSYLSKNTAILLGSVFSASLIVIFQDISLAGVLILVCLWFLAYKMGELYGMHLVWGMVFGYMVIGNFVDYYLANKQLFVVLLPGASIIELMVLLFCWVLFNNFKNKKGEIGK